MPLVVVEKTMHCEASLARLWPLLSDSSLLSELSGQTPYVAVDELQPDGSVRRRAKGHFAVPIASEWTEDLGEWVEQRYVRQLRTFTKGAFHSVDFVVRMQPAATGFDLHLRIAMETAGFLTGFGARLGLVSRGARRFVTALEGAIETELAQPELRDHEAAPQAAAFSPAPLPPAVLERLDQALAVIEREYGEPEAIAHLRDYLSQTPETWLQRIRPLSLARRWGLDEVQVVGLFLAAHHQGLLQLRWEVLCPRCRNAQDVPGNLADLPHAVHCTTCNIDFEQDFSANVELTFQPEPWLRDMPAGAYCMMGAPSVPHIKVQRHVGPGERLEIDPPLGPGSYRLRTTQAGDQTEVDWDGGAGFPSLLANGDHIVAGPPSAPGKILLDNQTTRNLTFVIEELAWRQDALTGDRVIVMPAFQHYCPEQLLRPGDDVAIANVVLLFSDLKGSTSLYEVLGDAAAYGLVRDHFDYLTALIEDHGGVLVKTIGDAVMAAFAAPAQAVHAALAAQLGIGGFNMDRTDGGVILKLGLHQGSCIAVTTEQHLDYFGSTVNVAARLQGESEGGDIVLSDTLMQAPGVADMLAAEAIGEAVQETARLRGVEKPVQLWRIRMD
ncbi:MAG: adenylate/guanylate cyclase domain-containing protein [Alphaproteobacteria bacterium]|jgi:class 3 adenylate cyclase|nr:adenylate/guanylate cyclase domain-containing protein [Alphaproteobacteria bacterium]